MKNIVYAGMDVHKEKTVITFNQPSKNYVSKPYETITDTSAIINVFKKARVSKENFISCYEAGALGYWLYRELNEKGYRCAIIAPSNIPRLKNRKVKTDRIDSKNLAIMLSNGMLTFVNVCDAEQESTRFLSRTHFSLAKDLRSHKSQLLSRLRQLNLHYPKSNWTKSYWRWYDKLKLNKLDSLCLDIHRDIILDIEAKMSQLKEEMYNQLNTKRYKEDYELLKNVRGLGELTIMCLLSEIPDYSLFKNGGNFSSFIGMTGSEYTSANKQKKGKITKAGNKFVRTVLVEAALSYTKPFRMSSKKKMELEKLGIKERRRIERLHTRLRKKYYRLAVISNKKAGIAIVAVARELGEAVWALMNRKYGTLD